MLECTVISQTVALLFTHVISVLLRRAYFSAITCQPAVLHDADNWAVDVALPKMRLLSFAKRFSRPQQTKIVTCVVTAHGIKVIVDSPEGVT